MAQASDEAEEKRRSSRLPTRKRWLFSWGLLVLIAIGLTGAWINRNQIAEDFITDALAEYDLPATYEIEDIAPGQQVLTNVVIGDPERPDLTIERVETTLEYTFGAPTLGRITLITPRLYGSYRDGQLSFGSLDPVLFAESEDEGGLPAYDIRLVDGRALLETDFGPVGIKAEGEGPLDDGFAGILAVNAPELAGAGCAANRATLYGNINISGGEPAFEGPLRIGDLRCETGGVRLRNAAVQLDANIPETLDGISTLFEGRTGALAASGYSAQGATLGGEMAWREGRAIGDYSVSLASLSGGEIAARKLSAEGSFQSAGNFQRLEVDSTVTGSGIRLGSNLDGSLATFAASVEDTLAAPLLAKLRRGLSNELPDSAVTAELALRRTGEVMVVDIPQASLRGGGGAALLSLARVQYTNAGSAAPRFFGNFATGGRDLPQITGRMERARSGSLVLRANMAEYTAGDARLALPKLVLAEGPGGAIGFSGRAEASGALPGGFARGLEIPLSGRWQPNGAFELWRSCTDLRFDQLAIAQLQLDERRLTLCPPASGAIVRSDGAGLRIAAGAPALDLSGRLGETSLAIASGPIGFAYPGVMSARALDVTLGPPGTALSLQVANLDARLGEDIAGSFNEADIRLDAVPMNLLEASGDWTYRDGVFALAEGAFRLEDREKPQRFNPLVSRDATLTLDNNLITAFAVMREPETDRTVTSADIRHDLTTGRGSADLAVRGLQFDEALQPADLSYLAEGVVALVDGSVRGNGRVDWSSDAVTSSGAFSSDGIDLAAAFGPVKGLSGTVEFTDLLSLTTAPDQRLSIASVNPGIEVFDGELTFALRDAQLLSVEGATWPLMGGTLTLRETDLNFAVSEERRYIFIVEGLDAAQFIQQMELANISATGTFDGILPIIFDELGNGRIENGALLSRPPGGNVSYVGELTYEDMGAIANFAFQSLRSLDYQEMEVGMDGNLTGEIVTRVRLEEVAQGEGADRNFITRRIAKIPLEFRVNITAPFYQLMTNLRSMYDPAYVRDPRDLGLIAGDGAPQPGQIVPPPPPALRPEDIIPDEPSIQQQESETLQ